MKYRIEYTDERFCTFAKDSKELISWLKRHKNEPIGDIRKVYKNGVTDSVIEKYKKYFEK